MSKMIHAAAAKLRLIFTWRNTLRMAGLTTMLWLLWSRQHPDPTALFFCGVLMGLPSFVKQAGGE